MTDTGYYALVLALVFALYGIVASIVGARRNLTELVDSGRNSIYVVAGLVAVAVAVLWQALLSDNFNLEYVALHTEKSLPLMYKLSALWGGQAGSLLLWTAMSCGFAVAATWSFRRSALSLRPYVHAVVLLNIAFFLSVVVFAANPFVHLWQSASGEVISAMFQPAEAVAVAPMDDQGLNPQLQNYWMVIHPVALYLGFVGMTVPFAFAVGALATRQVGNTWVKLIRKWVLVPWLFLTLGIILGSQWAYIELGWGGYWAWDAVENASLLPWLTATAFVHSIAIQERRGMLKVWNMVLIGLTWELTLFGTFLTRSGVIESVHAFALSPIGPMFAMFIVITALGYVTLLASRLELLHSENQLDAVLSRETTFLSQNVVFVLIVGATLLGTLFPTISEWVTGNKISLNAPYFNKVNGPIFLVLLLLMGVAPLLAWRRSSGASLRRNFGIPIVAMLLTALVVLLAGGSNAGGLVGFPVLAFVFVGIIQEYVRGVQARIGSAGEKAPVALAAIVRRNGRRYGGYIVHIGVLMVALGIIGDTFYQSEGQANLKAGESLTVANYTLTYNGLGASQGPNYTEFVAVMDLERNGKPIGTISPKKLIYTKNQEQPMTEVGLRPSLTEDVYVVLAGFDGMGATASFKVYVNPLMTWMWIGAGVIVIGVLVAAWPRRARVGEASKKALPAQA